MFKVTNAEQVFNEWDTWLAQVEAEVMRIAIDMMYVMLREAALRTPQYSGDMVANYNLSVNAIDGSFAPHVFPEMRFPTENPFQKEDMPAIMHTINRNAGRLVKAKLGDTLWLANGAVHDDDAYAWKIEDGLLKLRPQNAGGYGPIRKTRDYMQAHYRQIGRSNREMFK